ncbi:hypothetical protein NON20_04995 [Synechocystis sp. B12]|nr:hypothetical protein NON20_04995 [Synechocystis sp. B12]
MNIAKTVVAEQRDFFSQGKTKSVQDRSTALAKLKTQIQAQEEKIIKALKQDFGKPPLKAM